MPSSPLLLVATRNPGKLREIRQILHGLPLSLVSLADYPAIPDIVEDGSDLRENALIKARAAFGATGIPSLSDDSGLEVDALGGQPGVRSARFAGEDVTYEENNEKLLELMAGVPAPERTGRFVCLVAFCDGHVQHVERGECSGTIAGAIYGTGGFGYDPLFIPEGHTETFARLPPEVKNQISHRSVAFRKIKTYLARYFDARG